MHATICNICVRFSFTFLLLRYSFRPTNSSSTATARLKLVYSSKSSITATPMRLTLMLGDATSYWLIPIPRTVCSSRGRTSKPCSMVAIAPKRSLFLYPFPHLSPPPPLLLPPLSPPLKLWRKILRSPRHRRRIARRQSAPCCSVLLHCSPPTSSCWNHTWTSLL